MLAHAALVLLGLSPLLLLEAGLRIFGAAPDAPPKGYAWTAIDPFEHREGYAATKESYIPAIRPARFSIVKSPGSHRIFCLGGSSTFGYPYGPEVSWPALLEQRLDALTPQARAEVINLGGNSYGSARNLGTLRGSLAYGPDVLVLYAGMNEFVEDSYLEAVRVRPRVFGLLASLRTFALLERLLPAREVGRSVPAGQGGGADAFFFTPVVDTKLYSATPEVRRAVTVRYAQNIERMARIAQERSIPLLLCTSPSNLADWSPDRDDATPPDPDLARRWRRLVARARALEGQERLGEATAAYLEAAALWSGNAEVCFRLGRALLATGHVDEAGPWLARARDLDPAPVRATAEMNEIVRSIARKRKLPLVDLEAAFAAASPGGIVDDALILDHVHPTPRGAALIAREVWRVVSTLGAPWSGYRTEDDLARLAREQEIAAREAPVNANLAYTWGTIFERKGMGDQAISMFERAIALGNPFPYVRMALGTALARKGETERALDVVEKLVRGHPGYPQAYPLLAELRRQRGEFLPALRAYERAMEAGLADAPLLIRYAKLRAEQGDHAGALAVLDRGADLPGAGCTLTSTRGLVLESAGRSAEALALYRELIHRDPACHAARENLGLLQMNQGQWELAARTFEEALRQPGPVPSTHHLNLGHVHYYGLKNLPAAVEQFRAYLEADPGGMQWLPEEVLPLLIEPVERAR